MILCIYYYLGKKEYDRKSDEIADKYLTYSHETEHFIDCSKYDKIEDKRDSNSLL